MVVDRRADEHHKTLFRRADPACRGGPTLCGRVMRDFAQAVAAYDADRIQADIERVHRFPKLSARLLMNFVLMRHEYPAAVILNVDRKKYYRVLKEAVKFGRNWMTSREALNEKDALLGGIVEAVWSELLLPPPPERASGAGHAPEHESSRLSAYRPGSGSADPGTRVAA